MLVGERMSSPVITIPPDLPIVDALQLMKQKHIRRTPVVKDGRLVGIVSDKDLLNASPSPATAMSVWEMNYLLTRVRVADVMTHEVHSVFEDTAIEEAARLMADLKIGGLPVLRGRRIVGIITETDLFKAFLELMGARQQGVRVTAHEPAERAQLARLVEAVVAEGGHFLSYGQYMDRHNAGRMITFKIEGISQDRMQALVAPLLEGVVDIRSCC